MQEQPIPLKTPLALKIVMVMSFLFSVVAFALLIISHILRFRDNSNLIFHWTSDLLLLLWMVVAGWGFFKRWYFARLAAMSIFALVGYTFGLSGFLTMLDGSPNIMSQFISAPLPVEVTGCFVILVLNAWAFWILSRKDVRVLFQRKATVTGQ